MKQIIEKSLNDPETVIAFCALVISLLSMILTLTTIFQTRKHNRLSVKPLCHSYPPDYENWIAVIVQNKGVGPLITKSTKFYDENNNIKKYLIDLMPKMSEGFQWNDYTKSDHFIIGAGEDKILIEFKGEESNVNFREMRDSIRKKLGQITFEYEFTDVYNQKFPKVIYDLKYFNRSK